MIDDVEQRAVEVIDDFRKQGIQLAPHVAQRNAARAAVDHADGERGLEFLDQAGQGGLGDMQVLGGQRKTAGAGQRDKGAHLAQRRIHG